MKKFIWGALIGAGVALLYAPATGATIRSRLRDKATKLTNETTDFIEGKKKHLMNKMEGVKAKVRNIVECNAEDRDMAMTGDPSI